MSTKGPPWLPGPLFLLDIPYQILLGPSKLPALATLGTILLLSNFWQRQVTAIVPEPYLDEIFHIPQAQAYCEGRWDVWDPKLTTPPGL